LEVEYELNDLRESDRYHGADEPAGSSAGSDGVGDWRLAVEKYPLALVTAGLRLPEPRDPKLPTLFLIGDSTVRNGRGDGSNGQWGWGEPLVDRFDTGRPRTSRGIVGCSENGPRGPS
jgi:hypothetical protein